ncbi:MAG TPA: hypothetical protein VEW05_23800 [Candidatus Polarisedimenticolia bacterium]|nr:hypothetical protein [Candidatus Polarisedimenticolia bacterium]
MAPGWYRAIAASVLSLHAADITWVIFGAFFTRGRSRLAALTHTKATASKALVHIFSFYRREDLNAPYH